MMKDALQRRRANGVDIQILLGEAPEMAVAEAPGDALVNSGDESPLVDTEQDDEQAQLEQVAALLGRNSMLAKSMKPKGT